MEKLQKFRIITWHYIIHCVQRGYQIIKQRLQSKMRLNSNYSMG